MQLRPEEPACSSWRTVGVGEVWRSLLAGRADGERRVIAVDGRGGAGKSTVASLLARSAPYPAGVVHTDDVAWHHSFFGWDDLLREQVIVPFRSGHPVDFTPPAWIERGRPGAITVSAGCQVLLVEGTGVLRASLSGHLDAGVFVQADSGLAYSRLLARDGDTAEQRAFIADWALEEDPLLAAERPWDSADLIVCGTPGVIGRSPSADELVVCRGR